MTKAYKYEVDYEGLHHFLISLKRTDFDLSFCGYPKSHDTKIKEGHSIDDIDGQQDILQSETIFYEMPFLLDAIGGDLSVAFMKPEIGQKRKIPNPVPVWDGSFIEKDSTRLIFPEFGKVVIEDTKTAYGDWLNGYFMIPPQFYEIATKHS